MSRRWVKGYMLAFVPLKLNADRVVYGVGIDSNIDQAAVCAIIAGLNRGKRGRFNGLRGIQNPRGLGHPIGHSLSPVMHNASTASIGFDGIYLIDVHPDRLMEVLPAMADMGFAVST